MAERCSYRARQVQKSCNLHGRVDQSIERLAAWVIEHENKLPALAQEL
jgi:hypothetical protein